MHCRLRARAILILGCLALAGCGNEARDNAAARIIGMERAALDRWGRGDVEGYLELYSADTTYFDPALDKRLDGLSAVTDDFRPLAGKIGISRYEMIGAKVQQYGDVAVLTYNLMDEVNRTPAGPAKLKMR